MDQININQYNQNQEELIIFLPSPQQNKKSTHQQNKQTTNKQINQMLNSIGSSRPTKTSKNFNSKTKFNKTFNIKTACASSSHSFQITIKELMIMLPLHGQNTAALQHSSQRAGHTSKTNKKRCFC